MAEIPAPGARGATTNAASQANREFIPAEPVAAVQTNAAVQASDAVQANMDRLVRAVAGRILARLPRGSGLEMADLIQAGNIGLLQAKRTFKPENGASLAGYAKFRIRGEMLDTVRRCAGPIPVCFTRPGDDTDDMMDLEANIPAPAEHSPHSLLANDQRSAILGQEVARLPDRYRTVVRLRYSGEFSLREIGAVLRVRESRACQIHQSALGHLRRALSRRGLRFLSSLM
jgi:RNA polymerase sigma factor for flagellar operon FliA